MTTRRIVEDVVLPHGLNFIMGGTTRRFAGEFTSALEPGQYEVTVEIDLGDSRAGTRRKVAVEVVEPVPGRAGAAQGVVTLGQPKVKVEMRPGERSTGRADLTNNFSETVRITPNAGGTSYADWFAFAPQSLVLPPGRTRAVRITIRAPKDAPQDLKEIPVTFIPTTINGATFADDEAPTMALTLRVLAPRSAGAPRRR